MALIELKDVTFAYRGGTQEAPEIRTVLEHFDLSVDEGEFVAILGHNGSGKSTAAKLMNAILVPQSGQVSVDGIDTAPEENKFEIRQIVGMVFQNPDNQIVASVVEEDVAFGPENLGVEPDEIRRRVDDALETVGLSDCKLKAPHNLSGGQKQRLAVAGVLAMRPRCIVLDEPTAMLDPSGRREVLKTIQMLNREGITIVLITHFMDEAVQAGRVVVMDDGNILLDGAPETVFPQVDILEQAGLDVPQCTQLIHALRADGFDFADDILSVDACVEALAARLEA
ncbi:MAG: energy-coupling factor transporter ATPase [Clostridiales bacterium]|nr:energy-coupling factor transporter ATPase [Clostridiales bacterium]